MAATCGEAPITLNVGGTLYKTLASTLVSKSPFFKDVFDSITEEERQGEIFVDRDPEPFGYVLSYLRTGVLVMGEASAHMLGAVLLEADYYGIQSLVEWIDKRCRGNLLPRDEDTDYEKFEYKYLLAPKAEVSVSELVNHRCFPECFFRSIKELKIVSLSDVTRPIFVNWIDEAEVEHSMPDPRADVLAEVRSFSDTDGNGSSRSRSRKSRIATATQLEKQSSVV